MQATQNEWTKDEVKAMVKIQRELRQQHTEYKDGEKSKNLIHSQLVEFFRPPGDKEGEPLPSNFTKTSKQVAMKLRNWDVDVISMKELKWVDGEEAAILEAYYRLGPALKEISQHVASLGLPGYPEGRRRSYSNINSCIQRFMSRDLVIGRSKFPRGWSRSSKSVDRVQLKRRLKQTSQRRQEATHCGLWHCRRQGC